MQPHEIHALVRGTIRPLSGTIIVGGVPRSGAVDLANVLAGFEERISRLEGRYTSIHNMLARVQDQAERQITQQAEEPKTGEDQ